MGLRWGAGDRLAGDVMTHPADDRRPPTTPLGPRRIALPAIAAIAAIASLAAGCGARRATPGQDGGAERATGVAAGAEEPPPPRRPTAPLDAPDAATFQKRGELLDADLQILAQTTLAALAKGDAAALAKVTAPGVDAAAIANKLRGRVGEGPPRFEDAILTRDLIELRYKLTFDTDASAPRYLLELHLMYKRVEGFLPWRLTDAFVPGQ